MSGFSKINSTTAWFGVVAIMVDKACNLSVLGLQVHGDTIASSPEPKENAPADTVDGQNSVNVAAKQRLAFAKNYLPGQDEKMPIPYLVEDGLVAKIMEHHQEIG